MERSPKEFGHVKDVGFLGKTTIKVVLRTQ